MSLILIFGPMNSEKTTELLHQIQRMSISENRVIKSILFNSSDDDRTNGGFSTKNYLLKDSNPRHDIKKIKSLYQMTWRNKANKFTYDITSLNDDNDESICIDTYDIIAIDEFQFFNLTDSAEDIWEFFNILVNELGKIVIISSLKANSDRKKFGHLMDIMPLSDVIIPLNSVCVMCKGDRVDATPPACHTFCKQKKNSEVMVGNSPYISLCNFHYNQMNKILFKDMYIDNSKNQNYVDN